MSKTTIKEIFTSIQGEGPFIGYTQLFIRFCKCNFECKYCETDYKEDSTSEVHTPNSLAERIKSYDTKNIHSICLTGGEPLLETAFLKEFLRTVTHPVYLETGATLCDELLDIINNVKYISANIKLPSACGCKDCFEKHEEFIKICKKNKKPVHMKVVFDENITEKEIKKCIKIAESYDIEIILQPVTKEGKINIKHRIIPEILEKFREKYRRVRLIPQVHKFMDVR